MKLFKKNSEIIISRFWGMKLLTKIVDFNRFFKYKYRQSVITEIINDISSFEDYQAAIRKITLLKLNIDLEEKEVGVYLLHFFCCRKLKQTETAEEILNNPEIWQIFNQEMYRYKGTYEYLQDTLRDNLKNMLQKTEHIFDYKTLENIIEYNLPLCYRDLNKSFISNILNKYFNEKNLNEALKYISKSVKNSYEEDYITSQKLYINEVRKKNSLRPLDENPA